jgi:hypothetical protein
VCVCACVRVYVCVCVCVYVFIFVSAKESIPAHSAYRSTVLCSGAYLSE